MTGIFGILESSAMQCYLYVAPTQEFFFFIVTSMVHGPHLSFQLCISLLGGVKSIQIAVL
jgi:hypothetical protein